MGTQIFSFKNVSTEKLIVLGRHVCRILGIFTLPLFCECFSGIDPDLCLAILASLLESRHIGPVDGHTGHYKFEEFDRQLSLDDLEAEQDLLSQLKQDMNLPHQKKQKNNVFAEKIEEADMMNKCCVSFDFDEAISSTPIRSLSDPDDCYSGSILLESKWLQNKLTKEVPSASPESRVPSNFSTHSPHNITERKLEPIELLKIFCKLQKLKEPRLTITHMPADGTYFCLVQVANRSFLSHPIQAISESQAIETATKKAAEELQLSTEFLKELLESYRIKHNLPREP